jgi:hypothetical protein
MSDESQREEHEAVPDCLTIEEAARILRIGRTAAYSLARQWRDTDGNAGIPYLAFGASYRVPTAALESMLGRRITHVPDPKRANRAEPTARASVCSTHEVEEADVGPLRRRRPKSTGAGQGSLL